MPKILVNPGTPDAWEIELLPGPNRIGSNESNDFQIDHPSVSSYHCELTLSDAGVLLKDLGSARGTYLNREPVKEAFLKAGQHIQLGSVAMIYEPPVSGPPASSGEVMVAAPTPPPAPVAAPAPFVPRGDTEFVAGEGTLLKVGIQFCKNHPEKAARFFCNKCRNFFCDACVPTHLDENCAPDAPAAGPSVAETTEPVELSAALPRAFAYPFRDNGLLILIAGTFVFAGLALLSEQIYGVVFQIAAVLYLFAFLQSIITATAAEKPRVPDPPGFSNVLRSAAGVLAASLISFGPAAVLAFLQAKYQPGIPAAAVLAVSILGAVYFPMALLVVTLKNSALAANPGTVFSAIFKVPALYLIPAILMVAAFETGRLGAVVSLETKDLEQATQSMATVLTNFAAHAAWSFLTVYLLATIARILGLIYTSRRDKLGWF